MEEFYVKKIEDVMEHKKLLEKKLNVKVTVSGNKVSVEGNSIDEYEASKVFDAINFGFTVRSALLLKIEDNMFKIIRIREHTRRKLKVVMGRLIGREGKTKRVLSTISGCKLVIGESEVGIIGDTLDVENVSTAIVSLIKGSKQANMYQYLQRMNRIKKKEGYD